PSVILAQASLEGGDGNSTLAAVYNNHFGIKADKSWKGKVVRLKTREVFNGNEVYIVDGFRVYDKAEDSFRDRAEFLKQFSRYKKVWTAPTPFDQARELQAAGYATDPNYAVTINSIIRMNKLEAIDNELKKNATS
ncbi:MAG TPA: hypothetical protein DCS19_07400, partial [Flavobacterium sp.]|nr:hypothetical protein [Flavobacterium sp.]